MVPAGCGLGLWLSIVSHKLFPGFLLHLILHLLVPAGAPPLSLQGDGLPAGFPHWLWPRLLHLVVHILCGLSSMWDVSLVEGSTEQWAELSVGLLLLPPPDH